jgi:hypothetical protein
VRQEPPKHMNAARIGSATKLGGRLWIATR